MKRTKSLVAKYERMRPEELREATKAFDEEMVVDKSRRLTAEQVYGALTHYLAHRQAVAEYLAAQRNGFETKRQAAREADPMFCQKMAAARRSAVGS
jgi:hypothetical protein